MVGARFCLDSSESLTEMGLKYGEIESLSAVVRISFRGLAISPLPLLLHDRCGLVFSRRDAPIGRHGDNK
jgi:hypothetical protein